ncbi:MAG: dihydropteroate synthase [Lachnospiraceae bacterium]|nr:dihydropteroate synthase [Lachnospiraceae bacterium]
MKIGNREFAIDRHTYVMGILNMTPDSFSDGGKWAERDKALKQVERMLAEGMDILDIGGESTRPGHTRISVEEEIARVVPVIEAVKQQFDVPISLDTYKPQVAQAGIDVGVDLINDIWGLKFDKDMAEVIAKSGIACCLMHNREKAEYQDFLQEVASDLAESVALARNAGIAKDKIILDPGVGFAKSYDNNLEVIHSLEKLKELGYPLLLGTSRKSVIGLALDLPVEERLEGTLVTTVFGVLKGCAFVRVHDVKENVRAIRMTEAILQGGIALYGRDSY